MVLRILFAVILGIGLVACSSPKKVSQPSRTHKPSIPEYKPEPAPAPPAKTTKPSPEKTNPGSNAPDFQKRNAKPAVPRQTIYRDQVLRNARTYLGKRYQYGGTGKPGFDCSGLTCTVFRQSGLDLPRTSSDQALFSKKQKVSDCKPGDLIFFGKGRVDHVGIVIESSRTQLLVIHSTSSGGVVIDDVLAIDYWKNRILWTIDPYSEFMADGSR